MANFCKKCGAKINPQNGKCPNCDRAAAPVIKNPANNINAANTQSADKAKPVKKKSPKPKIVLFIVILLLIAGIAMTAFLAYKDKLDIPFFNNIFVFMGLKDELPSDNSAATEPTTKSSDGTTDVTEPEEDVDSSTQYTVPDFDAEKYFSEKTDLKSSLDAATSPDTKTEAEIYKEFNDRGFKNIEIAYAYSIDGKSSESALISSSSSEKHPMYTADFVTASGNFWMISNVNGSFAAIPLSYNYSGSAASAIIISETDTITSYDSGTNKFYINIPNGYTIKKVSRIDAATLEKLTNEEIDKL